MLFIASTRELIRNLWQFKTVVFLHWCLIRGVLFVENKTIHCETNHIYLCCSLLLKEMIPRFVYNFIFLSILKHDILKAEFSHSKNKIILPQNIIIYICKISKEDPVAALRTLFSSNVMNGPNKLECLFLTGLSCIV
jgi:hypothetical protein